MQTHSIMFLDLLQDRCVVIILYLWNRKVFCSFCVCVLSRTVLSLVPNLGMHVSGMLSPCHKDDMGGTGNSFFAFVVFIAFLVGCFVAWGNGFRVWNEMMELCVEVFSVFCGFVFAVDGSWKGDGMTWMWNDIGQIISFYRGNGVLEYVSIKEWHAGRFNIQGHSGRVRENWNFNQKGRKLKIFPKICVR